MADIGDEWQASRARVQTFLLRCWQESDCLSGEEPEGCHGWHYALVQINGPSQTKCFASLEQLVLHLRGRLRSVTGDISSLSDGSLQQHGNPLNSGSESHTECE
jgi:hypothetical protein